jgi:hypothetical protein
MYINCVPHKDSYHRQFPYNPEAGEKNRAFHRTLQAIFIEKVQKKLVLLLYVYIDA